MLKPKRKKGAKRPEVFMFLALEFLLLFTEVELLEAFNFIADLSEAAAVTVSRHSFKDLRQSHGDVSCLLCVSSHACIICIIGSDEDDLHRYDIRIFLVLRNVGVTDLLKGDSLADSFFRYSDLLTVAVR